MAQFAELNMYIEVKFTSNRLSTRDPAQTVWGFCFHIIPVIVYSHYGRKDTLFNIEIFI